MDEVVVEPAHAKLNPFLRVLGRREDGYHEVETLVLPISLADTIEVRPDPETVACTVTGPLAEQLDSVGAGNLVNLAAAAMLDAAWRYPHGGARVTLVKRIPIAAGLGGGSADAAATIRALDRLWGLGLDSERLLAVAAGLGSDVPALLGGRPAVARGRGERIEPVDVPRTWWVVVPQAFWVRAADAYSWWDEDGGPTGPEPMFLLDALRRGDVHEAGGLLFNDLEPSVGARHPEVRETRERLVGAGALGVVLCGSGPTMAGLCRDRAHAEDVASVVDGIAASSLSGAG